MPSVFTEILDEFDGGAYYSDEYLTEAYCHFLLALLDASQEERDDPRVIPFLEAGYAAYAREQDGFDSQAEVTRDMALAMVGGHRDPAAEGEGPRTDPPRPASPAPRTAPPRPWRPWSPSPPPGTPPRTATPPRQPRGSTATPEGHPQARAQGKRPRSPSPEPAPEHPTLEVLQSRERHLRRFNAVFREEVMQINGLGNALPNEEVMVDLFDTVLARQREALQAKDDDRVILEIQNTLSVNPLWFSMRRCDQLNGQVILDKLVRVLNSNQAFLAEGQFKVSYIHVATPRAGGRRLARVPNESMEQWLARKIGRIIYSPDSQDNMCLTRSVAVAKACGMEKRAFYRMKQPNSLMQRKEATALCAAAGIDATLPCGLDQVRALQGVMPNYRLVVFGDKEGSEILFKGEFGAGRKNIYLLWHEAHFYAILYPCQAFDRPFLCEKCVKFYWHKAEHRCEGACWRCFGPTPHVDPTVPLRRCPDCFHKFSGQECFDLHKNKIPNSDTTKCQSYKFCPHCDVSYSLMRGRKHECGFIYCKNCKSNVMENHICYMAKWPDKKKKKDFSYITLYYDIETTQYHPVEGKEGTFEHRPNLLVCQAVCDACVDIAQNEHFCRVCKNRQHIFHTLDNEEGARGVMSQFFDYLSSFSAKTELLLVGHNAKSFDAIFVLQEVIARRLVPELVLQGAKILCLKVGNWKFIDSLMFLPMPLSSMPKSFGLSELKGHWPFMANRPQYYNYEGPLLDKEMYCISTMKTKAAREFHQWHDEQVAKNVVFNFKKEIIEYCVSDVSILRQACGAFRKLFRDSAGFDPMFACITLSSACMAAYRRNFLPENTISIAPPGGYHGRGKQSHIALQWLDYEAHKLGRKISTIYTDKEVSVLGRRVDGYVEVPLPDGSIERRIYQFHGDYWHQCPLHYPPHGQTEVNRYTKTVKQTALFRRMGYVVREKWECEFQRDMKEDEEVKNYFLNHPTTRKTPLVLRETLAGGRTSALRWCHKADLAKGEKIKMVDIVSSYPNAYLRGSYPYGHPTIYMEGDPEMPLAKDWNGLVKCTILPPRDLFLPVLPYKSRGKLMFPLCRSCVEAEGDELCRHHDPKDRQLTDSWCAPEIHLALDKGYKIVATHEVYQYPGTMAYNPDTGENGLLSGYVRTFMALKLQASDWPAECDTQEKKDKFVSDVLKHDGITVNPEKMEKNPALRTLAKLILNSFWGKFGEKTLRSKVNLIYDYGQLMQITSDPARVVQSLVPLGDDCLQVTWKPIEDSDESLPTSSLLHASFTTCFGRLHLYRYLDIVQQRALYFDTDSVAYISRPGEPDLPLGSHLGDLTDQTQEDYGQGSFITEFYAGGPKNYAYKVAVGGDLNNVKVCIKVRGISINSSCEDLVTFDNLKSMVLGEREKVRVPIPHQIARLPTWQVVTRPAVKTWQTVNTKRRRIDVANTVPHGYNPGAQEDEEDQEVLEAMDQLME